MVKAVKRSLRYLPSANLTMLEFDCMLTSIASTINNKPLGFNISSGEVLTPNQLILGRAYDPELPPSNPSMVPIPALHSHLRNVVSTWFKRWETLVLS